jgi:hypothetical protein
MVVILVSIASALASTYNYNSTGFFVYEEWNDFNTAYWYNDSAGFYMTDGTLYQEYCEDCDPILERGIFLSSNPNFNVSFWDEWDYSASVRMINLEEAVSEYAVASPQVRNSTMASIYWNASHQWSTVSGGGAYFQATNKYLNLSYSASFSPPISMTDSYQNVRQYKRNLPDGSWYITSYINDTLYTNLSTLNMTEGAGLGLHNLSDFDVANKSYFMLWTYDDSGYQLIYDEVNFTVYRYGAVEELPNNAPNVTISSPANQSSSSSKPTVNYTAVDDTNATLSCSLYIDSILNSTNSSVQNNTVSHFSPDWSLGAHTYYISCNDGSLTGTSALRTFTYYRSLIVTSLSPADHTISGGQQNITFSAIDNLITSFSCTLRVDNVVNQTNASVQNNTVTTFPINWSIGSHLWNISCNDGEITNNSETRTFTFNSTHSFVIWNPANETRANVAEQIEFEVYDSDHATTSCALYVDAALNATNASTLNDTNTFFSPSWSQGIHTWYISCNDTVTIATSGTYYFDYDTSAPFIQSASPSSFNTTVFSSFFMNIIGNVTDNNLWRVNRTIYYPNGTVYHNNYSGDLAPLTTLYEWSDTFNTTALINGIYTMFIDAADSHTAKEIKPAKSVTVDKIHKKLAYELTYDTVEVALTGGTAAAEFSDVKTEKLVDRYTFEYNFGKKLAKGETSIFRVTSQYPIIYLEDSSYTAHFILAEKYWLDFEESSGNTVAVNKIDEYNYDVTITFEKALDKLSFNSLGGLNEANLSIEFEIDNCVPLWSCGGYGSCQTNDTAPCSSAVDLNTCGLSYEGDFSEFSEQACNYCSRNIVVVNATDCSHSSSLHCYNDTNFGSCCNVTSIAADCFADTVQTEPVVCVNESCNMFAYSANDITGAAVEVVAKFVIGLASVAFLVGAIWVGMFAYNRFKMR